VARRFGYSSGAFRVLCHDFRCRALPEFFTTTRPGRREQPKKSRAHVLEALFDAGFYLEATYPIRSDDTKGEGAKPGTFGSQLIEYDIIHVCRKRLERPTRVSWAKMRREVLQDVRRLQELLEHHAKEGLPAADVQVIRRGKALEYFSRHYGEVYVNDERRVTVAEALVGINQLIDEETGATKEIPPANAEPLTRQFLRIFDGKSEEHRD
jgi:hypothetical protein